ncbi:MAG: Ig-like domain-containing protein [Planctomycetaceae bacterium]|nr:Ig-like domain-containing protein [Planctomycetaceae bacterium]
MNLKIILATEIILLCLCLLGCGKNEPNGIPSLQPCSITVMLDDAPLPEATVLFKPTQDGGISASGITDNNGKALMKIQATYDGVPKGKYKVMIVKQKRERNPAVKDEDVNGQPGSVPMNLAMKMYIVTDFVDPKFGNASTPLEITIQEGKNEQTFNVTKPPKK